MSDEIKAGVSVVITDAEGDEYKVEALSGVETTRHLFPIVWVNRPLRDGGFEPTPWPAESVRLAAGEPMADDQPSAPNLNWPEDVHFIAEWVKGGGVPTVHLAVELERALAWATGGLLARDEIISVAEHERRMAALVKATKSLLFRLERHEFVPPGDVARARRIVTAIESGEA